MPVFSKKPDRNSNSTADLVNEINSLLSDMKKARESGTTQTGGNNNIVSEVNHLLSELRGVESNLTEDQLVNFAMKGGARRRKRAASRKSKRTRSKNRSQSRGRRRSRGRSRSVSKSQSKKGTRSQSKRGRRSGRERRRSRSGSVSRSRSRNGVSTSRSRSVSRSMSRSRSESRSTRGRTMVRGKMSREGAKRPPSDYIIKLTELKKHIKTKLPNENLNNVGAMSKAAAKLLSDNDRDTEKAKKNFNATSFLKDYNTAKKEIDAKRAAKKANKV